MALLSPCWRRARLGACLTASSQRLGSGLQSTGTARYAGWCPRGNPRDHGITARTSLPRARGRLGRSGNGGPVLHGRHGKEWFPQAGSVTASSLKGVARGASRLDEKEAAASPPEAEECRGVATGASGCLNSNKD
ncbi:hypothetical protein IMZ48_23305 [Candidatus Bathyarchaeota archaeon]|nr:hypothetical protein [Candidatus Bathyarchaeota archaeon]